MELPLEILSLIVSFLPRQTLISICTVNSIFNALSSRLIYKKVVLIGTKAMEQFIQGESSHKVNILSLSPLSKFNQLQEQIASVDIFSRILARCDSLVELHVSKGLQLPLNLLMNDNLRCKSINARILYELTFIPLCNLVLKVLALTPTRLNEKSDYEVHFNLSSLSILQPFGDDSSYLEPTMYSFLSAIFRKTDGLSSLTIKNAGGYGATDWLPISLITYNACSLISLEISEFGSKQFFLPLLRGCTNLQTLHLTQSWHMDTIVPLIDALAQPLVTLSYNSLSEPYLSKYAENLREVLLCGSKNIESLEVLRLSLEASALESKHYASHVFELCKLRKIVVKFPSDFVDTTSF